MGKIKIHKEFQKLIPPLNEAEFSQLEQNILAEGRCRDSIKLWRGYIADGHNRYSVCKKHNIPFSTQILHFNNENEVKIWIAENQLGRRNLSDAKRIEIAAAKLSFLQEKAKENQSAAGGNLRGQTSEPINMRKSIAQSAGVSEQTVQRYMKIAGSGTEELIKQVQDGSIKIGTAYNQLNGKEVNIHEKTRRKLYSASSPNHFDCPITYRGLIRHMDCFIQLYALFSTDDFHLPNLCSLPKLRKAVERQVKVVDEVLGECRDIYWL
jgi:hypothetical protein